MTNLEKILSGALVVVSGLGISAVVQAVRALKKDQETFENIQEKCEKIKVVLGNSSNINVQDKESE